MSNRKLTIVKYGDCPHHKVGMSYSTDSWDRGSDWTCKLAKDRLIVSFVERPSDEPKEIPNFCPLPIAN